MLRILLVIFGIANVNCEMKLSTNVIAIEQGIIRPFHLFINTAPSSKSIKTVVLVPQDDDIFDVFPTNFDIPNSTRAISRYDVNISSLRSGKSGIFVFEVTILPIFQIEENQYVIVRVFHNITVQYISTICGWVYFLAWSISFYPQIVSNYRRKSVVGLSFDFVSINFLGYILYTIFNISMRYLTSIKEQYTIRHPESVNPVYVTDVLFSLHSLIVTIVLIIQCVIYERGDQKLSVYARTILVAVVAFILVLLNLSVAGYISILDVVYSCSFTTVVLTIIKYVPQVYINLLRKSTYGWSIYCVIFDVIGGVFSISQVFFDCYNHDNWEALEENPTKIGLGIISTVIDLFFLIQHYILFVPKDKSPDVQINPVSTTIVTKF